METSFSSSQVSSIQERKGMSWKEGSVACSRRRERSTTADERKHQSSSQMSCTGKTNYFTRIRQQIPKAVVLHQVTPRPNQERSETCVGAEWQSQVCPMSYQRPRWPYDDYITRNINSHPQHTHFKPLKGLICFNFSCSPWFSGSSLPLAGKRKKQLRFYS